MATIDILRSQHVPQPFFPSIVPTSASQSNISRKRKYSAIAATSITQSSAMVATEPPKVKFDASKHLCCVPPARVYTMEELGRGGQGVSPNAVCTPFPLFTKDAINQMRAEALSKAVLDNCQYTSNLAPCQLRGYAEKYAPFIYEAWNSPELLEIVSKIAGIDLVPAIDFEIGHVNISVNSKGEQKSVLKKTPESAMNGEEDAPVVGWHTDSYPFVCVVMLSDCTNMVGGETALRTGSGEIMKVRGPEMGSAVILQGRYIEHKALSALGGAERITMVTSFRPRSAVVQDDTVLNTVRSVSDLSELYGQYSQYRLEMLEERLHRQIKDMQMRKQADQKFDTVGVKKFLTEQKAFIDSMLTQIIDEDKVIKGFTDDAGLLSKDLVEAANKKQKMALSEKTDA